MKCNDLKQEIKRVIESQTKKIEQLSKSDNPQTMQILLTAESMTEAFQAVLNRINGDRIALNLYSD